MRVAIDLRPLQVGHQNRGIGNYLVNILQYFPTDTVEYILVRYSKSDPVQTMSLPFAPGSYKEVVLTERKFGKSPSKLLGFIIGLIDPVYLKVLRHRPSLYIQPDYLLGLPRAWGMKKIVIAYDLIPLLFRNMYIPHWTRFAGRKQYRLRTRLKLSVRAHYHEKRYLRGLRTLRRASTIISISNTTTDDICRIAHVAPARIKTIYLAPSFAKITPSDNTTPVDALIDRIGRYIVFIGGTDPRRQAHEIVFAHNLLNARGHDMHLVFAGNEFVESSKELATRTKKAIEQSSYRDKIHLLGRINEDEKRALLSNAHAFVYPTLYEGFGLPMLEAMSCHSPVITYPNPATKEIAQKAALYTSTNDGQGIYNEILRLNDSVTREAFIARGTARVAQFSWENAGNDTVEAIFGRAAQ